MLIGLSLVGAPVGMAQGNPTATPLPTLPPITDPVGQPPTFLANYYEAWVSSPHAARDTEPFKHWDAEGRIPAACATCHSTVGYVDFVGGDGTAAGKVEEDKPVGGVVNCNACHDPVAAEMRTVSFPSGVTVEGLGDSTRCMVCHQGRSSSVQVNAAIEKAGKTTDLDTPTPDLRFINIHYYAAAASILGSEVQGGYQYEGKTYQRRFAHVEGYDTCAGCHNPHTTELKVEECTTCHQDVKTKEDLQNIRMQGSLSDYDGDGNIVEGVAAEIAGLQEALLSTLQKYAADVLKAPIAYSATAYPYFFADANANGAVDEGEKGYAPFSARLLQAAYNYQVSLKDPGNFAHNASYHIELLYDSIESLASVLDGGDKVTSSLVRNDPGHFDATGEPFRHWDAEGEVPGSCARCHTAEGLPTFLKNGTNIAVEPSTSLACSTCHDKIPEFTVRISDKVTFPSGAVVSFGEGVKANLCLNCHQGRESTVSVNRAITNAKVGNDDVTDKLTFRNVHYFAAGATIFGTEVKGAYEFEGKEYNGRYIMDEEAAVCSDCHNVHTLKIDEETCFDCHEDADTIEDIRNEETADFNGNGNTTEGIKAEIESLKADLLATIYTYATAKSGASIVYAPLNHPYWYVDTNGNGQIDPDELKSDNRFTKWTPNLLRAAYNYQYASKDPGVFAHNPHYILQALYDSIEAVGGDVSKYTRPAVKAAQ